MAEFIQAVKWMKEGKKVTIAHTMWYAKLVKDYIRIFDHNGEDEREMISTIFMTEKSWEIFEDVKKKQDKWPRIFTTGDLKVKVSEGGGVVIYWGTTDHILIDDRELADVIEALQFGLIQQSKKH